MSRRAANRANGIGGPVRVWGSVWLIVAALLLVVACYTRDPSRWERDGGAGGELADTALSGPDTAAGDASPDDGSEGDAGTDVDLTDLPDGAADAGLDVPEDVATEDVATEDAATEDVASEDLGPDAAGSVPSFTVGTWNLHDFSPYGEDEYRIEDIAANIHELGPDLLAVEELEVEDGTDGSPPQAWDALLEALPDYDGLHAPWDLPDSTVGLLYRPDRVTVDGVEVLFEDDWYAFPRPPLAVSLTLADGSGSAVDFTIVVLHLKAFHDSADRRSAACDRLDAWVAAGSELDILFVGDFNDDPHDPPGENVFLDTFLDGSGDYVFVTDPLPPESVTSTGWYHWVDGQRITGEFLDHAVVTGALHRQFATVVPRIEGVPPSQYDDYRSQYSDHFPMLVDFSP